MKIKLLTIIALGMIFLLTNCEVEDKKYTLTLSTNTENSGITSGGGEYEAGEEIPVNAIPSSKFVFVNWTEGSNIISTSSTFNYTMPSRNLTLTANFSNLYSLLVTMNIHNSGEVTGGGNFTVGEIVTLTATAKSGYLFVNWTEGETIISTNASISYTVPNRDVVLTANFKKVYNLTLNTNIPNAGNLTGNGVYESGQEVNLIATANTGYSFVNWSEGSNIVSANENFKYTVPSRNVTLTANFVNNMNTFTIQPDATQGKDATVFSLNPTTNYGTSTDFAAIAWTNSGTPVTIRSFIQFDFSSLPSNITIHKVMLYLYSYNNSSNGNHSRLSGSNAAVLQRVTESWGESTITWYNQPSSTNVGEVILPESSSSTQNYILDITETAKFMIQNPNQNYGYVLKLQNEEYYRALIFASSDFSSSRPKVVISYTTKK